MYDRNNITSMSESNAGHPDGSSITTGGAEC